MNSKEIRESFLNFFKQKNHVEIPGTSLISEDPTLLFVNAGVVQFKPYLLGERKPPARRIVNCQKCFRTVDIEKVGTNGRTLTFFEMLGNWSIGDYWKEEAISLAFEFLTKILKVEKERIFVSVFKGENGILLDKESEKIWQKLGIAKNKIVKLGMEHNFWIGGKTGPCGPCTEIYYDLGEDVGCKRKNCQPGCDCDRFLEIWNLVFMEYYKDEKGKIEKLAQKSVDTGAGLERVAAVLQNKKSVFETDLFLPLMEKIESKNEKSKKIVADHIKAAVFLISENVLPSNVERGYVLRRILRRAILHSKILKLPEKTIFEVAKATIQIYKNTYPEVFTKKTEILTVIENEKEKFEKTLESGLKKLKKEIENCKSKNLKILSSKVAFDLFQSYGFPFEITQEIAKKEGIETDREDFEKRFKEHQQISRIGAERKFGGLGEILDYKMVKLHTATHLLHAALREILGDKVKQMGSDITPERLRFDFSFDRKLEKEEIEKIEKWVQEKIENGFKVKKEKMSLKEALSCGALAFFKEKYPEFVTVYTIVDKKDKEISKEICAGPHVKDSSEFENLKFKIIKEEAVGSGIRRIRAILTEK